MFSSSFVSFSLNADRAPQLKASVRRLRHMEEMYLRKWEDLLAKLKVAGSDTLPTEEEILAFEKATKIALPTGFKEYCLVFGSGLLSDEFRICCPCRINGQWDLLDYGNFSLDAYKEAVKFEIEHGLAGHPALDLKRMKVLKAILNNSLPFADNRNAELFLWHLDSFSAMDNNYDIYRVPLDDLEQSALVGRDFFQFVSEFIYGTKVNDILPRDYQYPRLQKTFYRAAESD
jgi:hypothetical protein